MQFKRPLMLLGALVAIGAAVEYQFEPVQSWYTAYEQSRPLPGKAEVTGLKVMQMPTGRWQVEFDYFHPGPVRTGHYQVEQLVAGESTAQAPQWHVFRAGIAARGREHLRLEIPRPSPEGMRHTREIKVSIGNAMPMVAIASQSVPVSIEWPTEELMRLNEEVARGKAEDVVAAQALKIDTNEAYMLREARNVLELVLKKEPRTDSAYIELARVAMKSNWGPEGLAQAESLLEAARQIRPDNPNMKILLGYVYAHQKRFKDAESVFADASQAPTKNLWLWVNWGELLEMQGKPSAAVDKYKLAVAEPPKDDTYDRARRDSFDRLLALAHQRRDLQAGEALHKQRTAEYGFTNCYGPAYARFLMFQKVDVEGALAVGQKILQVRCPLGDVKEIMGVANYMKWATAKEPERGDLLREARVQFPAGPKLLYRLASNDRMLEVARQLVAGGDKVDQVDNMNFTALAYAMHDREPAVARRLIRLGAKVDAAVGPEQLPVALIPVVNRDFDGIKMMQGAGVDYSKLRYRGATAFDHARQTQDRQLLDALEPKGRGGLKSA